VEDSPTSRLSRSTLYQWVLPLQLVLALLLACSYAPTAEHPTESRELTARAWNDGHDPVSLDPCAHRCDPSEATAYDDDPVERFDADAIGIASRHTEAAKILLSRLTEATGARSRIEQDGVTAAPRGPPLRARAAIS
jgi:hypothetical protein